MEQLLFVFFRRLAGRQPQSHARPLSTYTLLMHLLYLSLSPTRLSTAKSREIRGNYVLTSTGLLGRGASIRRSDRYISTDRSAGKP